MLASIEPRALWMRATSSSCIIEWPASVAWFVSMLSLTMLRRGRCRPMKLRQVAASKSYWCLVGSFGLGSNRNCP